VSYLGEVELSSQRGRFSWRERRPLASLFSVPVGHLIDRIFSVRQFSASLPDFRTSVVPDPISVIDSSGMLSRTSGRSI
jgi:hypothetical protein